jgi:hypothetical protein
VRHPRARLDLRVRRRVRRRAPLSPAEEAVLGSGGLYLCADAHCRHVVRRAWHDLRIHAPCVAHLVDASARACRRVVHACVRAPGRDPAAPLVRLRPRHPLPPAEEAAWVRGRARARARARVRARARARVHDVSHGHGARVARLAQ